MLQIYNIHIISSHSGECIQVYFKAMLSVENGRDLELIINQIGFCRMSHWEGYLL